MKEDARQLAFLALRSVQRGAFADVALDRVLKSADLGGSDRRFITELVYGSIRRQRTLNALIDQFAQKKTNQPSDLRLILQLGLYQLRYLDQVPASAAVNTTVELVKRNGFSGLAGFVNGLLRQYLRQSQSSQTAHAGLPDKSTVGPATQTAALLGSSRIDPLILPADPVARIAIQESYPDWIVQVWVDQFGLAETERLCHALNCPPHIDLRINPLCASLEQVESAFAAVGIETMRVPPLPQALRLPPSVGAIQNLPGFAEGWWTVQDSSAQLVGHLLHPQPGEVVIDACAAPGGKTTHLAELMRDQGTIWACDRHASRLRKLQANAKRLNLHSIQLWAGDSREFQLAKSHLAKKVDRVLLDAPCSGLGTLNRHADARWRQSPDTVRELAQLQTELLAQAATWVKPNGVLVYATCTLHPLENEAIITAFLQQHPTWQVDIPTPEEPASQFVTDSGWLKVLPQQQAMDGFFMVRLRCTAE